MVENESMWNVILLLIGYQMIQFYFFEQNL